MVTETIRVNMNQQLLKILYESLDILGYEDLQDLINVLLHRWVESQMPKGKVS